VLKGTPWEFRAGSARKRNFTGAMYVSYLISLILPFAIYGVAWVVLAHDSLFDVGILCLVSGVVYLPLVPLVFRYSRILWMHLDRKPTPDIDDTAL
jgi:membrane protein YdbS with pleckstrin-like domain